MINGLNFLRKSNVWRIYPDDKWVSGNWRVCLSGSEKEFAIVNLSSYLLASAAVFAAEYRMRELRYTGRNSPDIWTSRSSRIGHIYMYIYIYRPMYPTIFRRGPVFLLTVARGEGDRRVKNASYFARLYLCLPYISRALDLSPAFVPREIYRYMCAEALIPQPFLHPVLPLAPLELFLVGILCVRIDSCPI